MSKKDDFQTVMIQWVCTTATIYLLWEFVCR
jgi:hypothetical protein